MHRRHDVLFAVVKDVRYCLTLSKTERYQEGAVFLLPPVGGGPRAIHVAYQPCAHCGRVFVLGGQLHERGRLLR